MYGTTLACVWTLSPTELKAAVCEPSKMSTPYSDCIFHGFGVGAMGLRIQSSLKDLYSGARIVMGQNIPIISAGEQCTERMLLKPKQNKQGS
ncbi:hypothetical protein VTO42DRAFT_8566 [Malbranchea cinnamomea]